MSKYISKNCHDYNDKYKIIILHLLKIFIKKCFFANILVYRYFIEDILMCQFK